MISQTKSTHALDETCQRNKVTSGSSSSPSYDHDLIMWPTGEQKVIVLFGLFPVCLFFCVAVPLVCGHHWCVFSLWLHMAQWISARGGGAVPAACSRLLMRPSAVALCKKVKRVIVSTRTKHDAFWRLALACYTVLDFYHGLNWLPYRHQFSHCFIHVADPRCESPLAPERQQCESWPQLFLEMRQSGVSLSSGLSQWSCLCVLQTSCTGILNWRTFLWKNLLGTTVAELTLRWGGKTKGHVVCLQLDNITNRNWTWRLESDFSIQYRADLSNDITFHAGHRESSPAISA